MDNLKSEWRSKTKFLVIMTRYHGNPAFRHKTLIEILSQCVQLMAILF